MDLLVRRLDPSLRSDFYPLHHERNGYGQCQCVAWWVPTWEGWAGRTPEANRALRDSLFDLGEYDGYLLFQNEDVVGWAQVGLRDRLAKLVREYDLPPEPSVWAITCFLLAPGHRGLGPARHLLVEILADLPDRGATDVEAFPRRGASLPPGDVWTGPEALFRQSSFSLVQEHPRRPRYRRSLMTAGEPNRRV